MGRHSTYGLPGKNCCAPALGHPIMRVLERASVAGASSACCRRPAGVARNGRRPALLAVALACSASASPLERALAASWQHRWHPSCRPPAREYGIPTLMQLFVATVARRWQTPACRSDPVAIRCATMAGRLPKVRLRVACWRSCKLSSFRGRLGPFGEPRSAPTEPALCPGTHLKEPGA
jgi:hypothetical protein